MPKLKYIPIFFLTFVYFYLIPIQVNAKYYALYEEDVIKQEIRSMNHVAIIITIISSFLILFIYLTIYKINKKFY